MKKKLEQTPPSGSAVYLVSLGCSKNLVDTEVIAGSLLTAGYLLAFDPEEADLYLINSCVCVSNAENLSSAASSYERIRRDYIFYVFNQKMRFARTWPRIDFCVFFQLFRRKNITRCYFNSHIKPS